MTGAWEYRVVTGLRVYVNERCGRVVFFGRLDWKRWGVDGQSSWVDGEVGLMHLIRCHIVRPD